MIAPDFAADSTVDPLPVPSPDEPSEALAAVVALRRLADRLELAATSAALDQGWTWHDIAQALGVSKQAAHKRLAPRLRP